MRSFVATLLISAAVSLLAVAVYHGLISRSEYQPYHHRNVAYLDTADNGFSKGWQGHERAQPRVWFDMHMHMTDACSTVGLIQEGVGYWKKAMGDLGGLCGGVILDGTLDTARPLYEYCRTDTSMHPFLWLKFSKDPPAPAQLEYLVKTRGVEGVKLHNGFIYDDALDYRLMDSEAWNAIYATCGKLGIPILWHLNHRFCDPEIVYWDCNYEKIWKGLPYTNRDVLALFEKIADKHKDVQFILAHMNFMGYDSLGTLFDRHPNVCADGSSPLKISTAHRLTPREIQELRPFFIKYQDRIFFGTDNSIRLPPQRNEAVEVLNMLYLYTDYQYFLLQLELPHRVIDKIAYRNAEKALRAKF